MNWFEERPRNLCLPLDFATAIGGRLKDSWRSLAENEICVWFLSSEFLVDLKDRSVQSEIRTVEALKLIEEWPIDQFCAREKDVFLATRWLSSVAGLERKVGIFADAYVPDFKAWGKAIFKSLPAESLGELEKYLLRFPEAREFPWEGLRFFAGFLRKQNLIFADDAALDWARFEAQFSPQNETRELASLASGEVIVNPTLQILKPTDSTKSSEIHLVWRWSGQIHEVKIGWRDAMLIDEASESPRAGRETLLAHVNSEGLNLSELLGDGSQTFEEAFARLTLARVLLLGD